MEVHSPKTLVNHHQVKTRDQNFFFLGRKQTSCVATQKWETVMLFRNRPDCPSSTVPRKKEWGGGVMARIKDHSIVLVGEEASGNEEQQKRNAG